MEPRLKTSTQWSPFPAELCEQTSQVLAERFAEEYGLENASFVVDGRIYQGEILGRYGLTFKDQLKQHNFEVSFDYTPEETDKILELIQKSLDVVEHLWTELLEEDLEDSELPLLWESMPIEKKVYHYRYSTVNSELEREADRLLKEYEKKLVYESSEQVEIISDQETPNKTVH